MSKQRFQIGLLAVVALIALRLALGCHFLYEGLWKIKHHDEFTAEPFLTQAKGPISPLFYAMVPDINGQKRLCVKTDLKTGKRCVDSAPVVQRWKDIQQDFLAYYGPASSADDSAKRLERESDRTLKDSVTKLDAYLNDNLVEIAAYLDAIDRADFDNNNKEKSQSVAFQKKRRWDKMMDMRREADGWINNIEAQEKALKNSLFSLLDDKQKELGRVPLGWNPFRWGQMDLINFAVIYGLTAIGVCLMLGFFTPLAALGGAGFMCFVVMTQPAFPTIYPPDPAIVGHALLVNKDFVEMMALLVVAAASAGRWGGLDFFLYRWFLNPFLARFSKK